MQKVWTFLFRGSQLAGLCLALACFFSLLPSMVQAESELAVDRQVPWFVESSADLELNFLHRHFGVGEKYMPENMAPGVVVFDYDGDGDLDVYMVQGAPWGADGELAVPKVEGGKDSTNRLFRQGIEGRFEDVTVKAGVGHRGYGMGAAFGDYDGDGDLDLHVTNYGPNALYRNRGDGTFEDVTSSSGISGSSWSTGSGFVDYDGDGDLDLFVANYVDFGPDKHKWCGNAQRQLRSYCHPDVYEGQPDVLYRNDGQSGGRARFTDVSQQVGLLRTAQAKGLGVLFEDLNGDGSADLLVANDSTMNHLYLWRPAEGAEGGRFEEGALLAGVGFNRSGAAEASMGVAAGDVDEDGDTDLLLTHLDQETNTLYRNEGDGLFVDATQRSGLAVPSLPWVGFGTLFFDANHDGHLDLLVANGHILDNIEQFDPVRSHRQPAQLFVGSGRGSFEEASGHLGRPGPWVARGAVAADLDRDGDLDLVIAQNDGPLQVLINQLINQLVNQLTEQTDQGQGAMGSLEVGLEPGAGRHILGARLELQVGPKRQVRSIRGSESYLSQGPLEVHFGWGPEVPGSMSGQLTISWPSGEKRVLRGLEPGHRLRISPPASFAEPLPR